MYLCICVFVFVLILAMIQDQALVASKHFLIETENKTVTDNAEVGRVVYFFIWVCVLHCSIANPKVKPRHIPAM